jgi:hypothetical protein
MRYPDFAGNTDFALAPNLLIEYSKDAVIA